MPYAEQRRSLVHAAMASMALHALVLSLSAPTLKQLLAQPFPSSATIVARLVEPAAAPEAPAPQPAKAAAPKKLVPAIDRQPTPAAVGDAASPPVPASAPPERPAIDATSVAQYRQQLISSAVRHKHYPPAALDNDWQGDVVVRLSVLASGSVAEVSVKASSGHVPLDAQALEMFRLAAAEVPVPPALRGQEFGVEVRASYELRR